MINKIVSDDGGLVRVTFTLPSAILAERVNLVGDFNGWDTRATPMLHDRGGARWMVSLNLEGGQRYRFRYLVDGQEWLNDWYADDHVENPYGSYDSIVDLTRLGAAVPAQEPMLS